MEGSLWVPGTERSGIFEIIHVLYAVYFISVYLMEGAKMDHRRYNPDRFTRKSLRLPPEIMLRPVLTL